MGYLIDTNILSELRKQSKANAGVQAWYAVVQAEQLYLSVLTLGEVRQGIERLRRRDPQSAISLERWLLQIETEFSPFILPITQVIADRWGCLNAPDKLPVIDGLLAATALVHDLTLVTRNIADVKRSGAKLLNPFI
jgi:toxin FitB